MKKIGVLVLLLVGTIALAADYTKDNVEAIKAKVQKGEVVLIDVREKNEWDEGHVSGAKLLSGEIPSLASCVMMFFICSFMLCSYSRVCKK